METTTAVRNMKKRNDGLAKIDSAVYLRQRKIANARKRKFLERMTPEQREIKRAKDREYHKKKKREMRLKKIDDLTEQEKEKKRISWKKASKKYREAKRNSSEPKDESALKKVRRQGGRKIVGRGSYNEIEELEKRINQKKQEIKYLKEQAQAREEAKKKPAPTIPDSEVDSFKDIRVPSQIQQNHQFVEFLNTKVQVKADALLRSYQTGEVFEICNIEFTTTEQSMLHMAINILQKEENSNIMILSSDVKLHEIMNFCEQDNGSETETFKINCLRKIIC